MGLFDNWYKKEPKKEILKGAPAKQGIELFFDVFWREFWELCKLNLIFILFCLPVVTIPAALTAMSKITMMMLMDKPMYTFDDFRSAFKAEWKRAGLVGLIYFPLLALTVLSQLFYSNVYANFVLYVVSMFACAVLLIAGFYIFPMIAMLDFGIKGIFKNAFLMTFLRMPQNILAFVIIAVLSFLVWMFLPPTIMALLLIFFALCNLIATFCAYTGLKKHIIKTSPND
jgi:uncharacterized membrane protein YesL